MKIFVTGFHRAGTHTAAEHLARKYGLLYLSEERIRWDSMEAVQLLCEGKSPSWKPIGGKWTLKGYNDPMIAKGFVLQCPGLAHKTLELTKMGRVCWSFRDRIEIINSMRNANFNPMAWKLMADFKAEFPDDPIWNTLEYDGKRDVAIEFVIFYNLLIDVKEYFYNTRFKDIAERVDLESLPVWDENSHLSGRKPLSVEQVEVIQ